MKQTKLFYSRFLLMLGTVIFWGESTRLLATEVDNRLENQEERIEKSLLFKGEELFKRYTVLLMSSMLTVVGIVILIVIKKNRNEKGNNSRNNNSLGSNIDSSHDSEVKKEIATRKSEGKRENLDEKKELINESGAESVNKATAVEEKVTRKEINSRKALTIEKNNELVNEVSIAKQNPGTYKKVKEISSRGSGSPFKEVTTSDKNNLRHVNNIKKTGSLIQLEDVANFEKLASDSLEEGEYSSATQYLKKILQIYDNQIDKDDRRYLKILRKMRMIDTYKKKYDATMKHDEECMKNKVDNEKIKLFHAVLKGDLVTLNNLKKAKVKFDVVDENGNNPLHLASMYPSAVRSIKWLIHTAGISVESAAEGFEQKTPFLLAATEGNLPALKVLKAEGAKVDVTEKLNGFEEYGNNALHLAASFAPEGEGIEWLIDTTGLSIESKGKYERTPFLCAACHGNLPTLKLLNEKSAKVHATDQHECNALHSAALLAPEGKGIEWLIDTVKISVESICALDGMTPFLLAAQKGNLPALKILRRKKAKVRACDKSGNNALHLAAKSDKKGNIIEWLIDIAEIPVDSKTEYGITPFLRAARSANFPALRIFQDKGAKVEEKNEDGENALHLVVVYSSSFGLGDEEINWLIDTAGIPIESEGRDKKTAFLHGAAEGALNTLKLLKKKGANIKAVDQDGKNALDLATSSSRQREATIDWLKRECGF